MRIQDVRVLIVRAPGTNCDWETALAFKTLGVSVDVVPFSRLVREKHRIDTYDVFVIPGGFSYGDFVRAGAILGKKLVAKLGKELTEFLREGKPIIGICNGFQVLVEAGLLPGRPELKVALTANLSMRYECRWTIVKKVNRGRCKLLDEVSEGMLLRIPVGHGEGRFVTESDQVLRRLIEDDYVVFRYCKLDGSYAEGEYPWNPNGSVYDIAAICNDEGNVLGMMPHPERAFFKWQLPDWTRSRADMVSDVLADGALVFKSIVKYVSRRL